MADFQKTKTIYEEEKSILTFKIYCCRDELEQRTNRGNFKPSNMFLFEIVWTAQ